MAKEKGEKLQLKINGYTPETLPMARLAMYLADLALLLGHEDKVHFVRVGKGSASLVHEVEKPLVEEVLHRLRLVKNGLGPVDAQVAFRSLNAKLSEDGKTAEMKRGRGKLLRFPGVEALPPTYGPIYVQGHLDGNLIRVGGKDATKPIHLMNEDAYYICNANAEVARQLSSAYERSIRVYGSGKWLRQTDGKWILDHFTVKSFDFLDESPLSAVVKRVREIPNNGWKEVEDPLGELASIREREA